MASSLATALAVALAALVVWPIVRQQRWRSLSNLRGPQSKSWWTGNFLELFQKRAWGLQTGWSREYGGVFKFMSFFGAPALYVTDPKAMHQILVKDQETFEEHDSFLEGTKSIFGPGLLSTTGHRHRKQRKMLNPVFSIAHMKRMVPTFYEVVDKLRVSLETQVKGGPQEIDLLSWMTRTALELIGQSGLGYSFDPLTADGVAHPYSSSVKNLGSSLAKLRMARTVLFPPIQKYAPPSVQRALVNILCPIWPALREVRDMVDIMTATARHIYDTKKTALKEGGNALEEQVGKGNDLITLLIKANMEAAEADRLPEDEVLGQISTFTFAAMDTTSSALSRIFSILSERPDWQEKLRQEIHDAKQKHGDQLSYEELMALPLLDATCRETLRLYAPVVSVMRVATKDGHLPLSNPVTGVDGQPITELLVPRDTKILVGLYAANRNPDLWGPDAHEWKPERWTSGLPEKLIDAKIPGVYSHLMTFIGGGRSCIGFKFSELEMKVVLVSLLDTLKFSNSDKEIVWHMGAVAHPIVTHGETQRQRLPIKVELA